MAFLQRAPAPLSTPISDTDQRTKRLSGYVPTPWSDYFNGLDAQLAQSFAAVDHVQIPNGSAAIGVTPITNNILGAGLYRVTMYLVTLQADNVGSSVQLSWAFTDRSVLRQLAEPALTVNNVTTGVQSFSRMFRVDRSTPITYTVAYTSTGGAPKMIFGLDLMLEQVLSLP